MARLLSGFRLAHLVSILAAGLAPGLSFHVLLADSHEGHFERIGPVGGDVRSLLIDSRRPSQAYIGTSDGRIFKSLDAGKSWHVLFPGIGRNNFVIDKLIQHPSSPDHIYACAWDLRSGGGGLFESLDAGKTWTEIILPRGPHAIRDFAICTQNPGFMIVGTLSGIFLSRNGGLDWQAAGPAMDKVESVAIDPMDPNFVYVGTWRLGYRSSDFGATWKRMGQGILEDSDLFSIAIDRQNPTVLYAGACSGVYRSGDRGATWTRLRTFPDRFTVRAQIVSLDPANPHRIYSGTTEGLFVSENEGQTWTRKTKESITVNDIKVDPENSQNILLGTEGGVLASADGGRTWVPSNTGFVRRQVTRLLAQPPLTGRDLTALVPGKKDGGFYQFDSQGNQWVSLTDTLDQRVEVLSFLVLPGKLGWLAGTNRGIYLKRPASSQWVRLQGPVGGRGIHDMILDAQSQWVIAATDAGIYRARLRDLIFVMAERGNFAPAVFSLVSSSAGLPALYAGSDLGVLRSLDEGATWQVSTSGIPVQAAIRSIAPSPVPSGRVFAGTSLGLFLSEDAGGSWSKVGAGLLAADITSVLFADGEGKRIAAADGTFGGMFVSADGGKQWNKIGMPEFSSPVRTLARDAMHPLRFYLGTTSDGVYRVTLQEQDFGFGPLASQSGS